VTNSTIKYGAPLAQNYNRFHQQPDCLFTLQLEKIKHYLNITPSDNILDVGCGSGRLFISLQQQATIWGVEQSEEMIAQIPQELKHLIFKEDFCKFVNQHQRKKVDYLLFDSAYFSFSLHQMGTKLDQLHLLQKTFSFCLKPRGKILLISVSRSQFDQVTINQFFPKIKEIDEKRFLFEESLSSMFHLKIKDEQNVYSTITKEILYEYVKNKYISTLQLLTPEEYEKGLNRIERFEEKEIPYLDCYTYYLLEEKK